MERKKTMTKVAEERHYGQKGKKKHVDRIGVQQKGKVKDYD